MKVFYLKEGTAWNPLRKFPRNNLCFCGSGKKAKNCCISKLNQVVPKDVADEILANWEGLTSGRVTMTSDKEKGPKTPELLDASFFQQKEAEIAPPNISTSGEA